MQLLGRITLVSAIFASLSTANPIEKRDRHFSVKQAARTAYKVKNGPSALAKAYRKYGVPVPHQLAKAATNDGRVSAVPVEFDVQYLCPVTIGSNQSVMLNFDTGSADLWVFSSRLPTAAQQGHGVFNPTKSSTFKYLAGNTWNITYADGSGASGIVGTDTVAVGGTSVQSQAVELADQVSDQFASSQGDGLLGLSFSIINTVRPQRQVTFFDTAKATLSAPLFTADLRRQSPGSYDFGYIDKAKYKGPITYTPVNSGRGFWEFTSSGFKVGNGSFQSRSIVGIADTGTTLLIIDDFIASSYYSTIRGAYLDDSIGGYIFPCSARLPDFTFGIGNQRAVISGTYINFAPADTEGTVCFGGIQPRGNLPFTIWGDIMFKAQFVVFDGGNNRLGFAAKS
ncbi:MAG: Type I transmembrane sorting receptor [Peltula sp. TS41687]|nr:MAG: Type I transmembrane sorting receptor [Peltula sp. TS41687]